METYNSSFTESQKNAFAIYNMRDAVGLISERYHISYEEALLSFANSRVYDTLFDFETGIYKESPEYLYNLYAYCLNRQ